MTKSVFTSQYERLCQILINTRIDAGLSQAELARRLGRPQSFVSKYETRQRRLDVVEFLEVAACMGRSGPDLLRELTGGKSLATTDAHKGVEPVSTSDALATPGRGRDNAAPRKKPPTASASKRGR